MSPRPSPSGVAAFADDAPPWLRQASTLPVPTFDKKVGFVVLVDNSTVMVAVPAAQYKTLRGFLDRIRAAEQAPVVLVKK